MYSNMCDCLDKAKRRYRLVIDSNNRQSGSPQDFTITLPKPFQLPDTRHCQVKVAEATVDYAFIGRDSLWHPSKVEGVTEEDRNFVEMVRSQEFGQHGYPYFEIDSDLRSFQSFDTRRQGQMHQLCRVRRETDRSKAIIEYHDYAGSGVIKSLEVVSHEHIVVGHTTPGVRVDGKFSTLHHFPLSGGTGSGAETLHLEPFTVTPAWHGTGGTELSRVNGGTGYSVGDELTLDTTQFEDWKLKNGTKFRVTAVHTCKGFTDAIDSGDRYVSVFSTSTVQDHSSESAPEYHLCGNPFGNTIRFQVKQYIYPHVTGQGLSNFGHSCGLYLPYTMTSIVLAHQACLRATCQYLPFAAHAGQLATRH